MNIKLIIVNKNQPPLKLQHMLYLKEKWIGMENAQFLCNRNRGFPVNLSIAY